MSGAKANEVSTPTEAWLKEAEKAAAKLGIVVRDKRGVRTDEFVGFQQGAQWQLSRSAPDEQEWEKIRRDEKPFTGGGFWLNGFDAAVSMIARPLKAELTKARELNLSGIRALNERDSALAEAASLRAENKLLTEQSNEDDIIRKNLRAQHASLSEQLAEATKALEEAQYELFTIAHAAPLNLDGRKLIQWENAYHAGIASKKAWDILAKLKAGRKEG